MADPLVLKNTKLAYQSLGEAYHIYTERKIQLYPRENAKAPQDVLATLYHHLGVDIHAEYPDLSGRPHPVLPFGKRIEELF